ncbi:chorismate synthase [Persicobacter diffluens]|uniref:Chorismate synthase n=1 Tax=Persicobacter diffluens TaxID=981 RepID=A0AAN5AHZ6_9BACT|nr:chorismate synthase [Persicobacter diffluens]
MGNIFGRKFRITTFGESHGRGLGVTIDGCPAGVPIDEEYIQTELDRRRPGQSKITTQRKEGDKVEILSGVFEGLSTGTPIGMIIMNQDQKSKDYSHIAESFRPSHADFTYHEKYGHRDYRGGGRSSARETAARVAAGAVAKKMLAHFGIDFKAWVSQVGPLKLDNHYQALDLSAIESNIVRCPDANMAEKMIELIDDTRKKRDTIGGVVSAVISGVPVGLGEPVFDRLNAELGKAMLSINAAKGFEYGSGFEGVSMYGSEHNDKFFTDENGQVKTETNYSGGIQGGISNGQDIFFRVAFKPVATIMIDQESIDIHGGAVTVSGKGRHDPCVVPRAVPIVEAMAALVIADHFMLNQSTRLDQLKA